MRLEDDAKSAERPTFLWECRRTPVPGEEGDVYYPLVLDDPSQPGSYFLDLARRITWLTLATWGKLSLTQLKSALAARRHARLDASFGGMFGRAAELGVVRKQGQGTGAIYQLADDSSPKTPRRYLPFNPSSEAIQAARQRAREYRAPH